MYKINIQRWVQHLSELQNSMCSICGYMIYDLIHKFSAPKSLSLYLQRKHSSDSISFYDYNAVVCWALSTLKYLSLYLQPYVLQLLVPYLLSLQCCCWGGSAQSGSSACQYWSSSPNGSPPGIASKKIKKKKNSKILMAQWAIVIWYTTRWANVIWNTALWASVIWKTARWDNVIWNTAQWVNFIWNTP